MIFNFLRQYLKDDELENAKIELAETKAVLDEYKIFIQEQRKEESNGKDKVEPDFLVLVWASVGLAISFGAEATTHFPTADGESLSITSFNAEQTIWLVLALTALAFLVINVQFVLDLTLEYAKSKSNPGYKKYAYSMFSGIALLILGLVILSLMR